MKDLFNLTLEQFLATGFNLLGVDCLRLEACSLQPMTIAAQQRIYIFLTTEQTTTF